eukprot:scaffold115290_cov15-Tisochrysis_lutea.AAC.1
MGGVHRPGTVWCRLRWHGPLLAPLDARLPAAPSSPLVELAAAAAPAAPRCAWYATLPSACKPVHFGTRQQPS